MQRALEDFKMVSSSPRQKKLLTTTLYELIEAIHEEVLPEEKQLVPEIVIDLLNTCRSNCWVQ